MERLDRIKTRTGRSLFLVKLMFLLPLLFVKLTDGIDCCEGEIEGGESASDGTSEWQSSTAGSILFYCSLSAASEPPSYSY